MQLVEQHSIDKGDPRWQIIDQAAWFSKNIYNAANYIVRQSYIAGQGYLTYKVIEKRFKQRDLLPDQQLPLKVVQHVLKQVDHDWQSYFAALAEWKAHPDKFQGKPRLPKYKDTKQGRNLLVYTAQAISRTALAQGWIVPSGLPIRIKTVQRHVDQVRIVPRSRHYLVEVVYTVAVQQADVAPNFVLGVDLGIDNLAALASNQPGFVPLLVNGKPLKSINQWDNKEQARLKAGLDGRLINADVNGAYNIVRKVIPNAFSNGIGGAVVHPVRVHPA